MNKMNGLVLFGADEIATIIRVLVEVDYDEEGNVGLGLNEIEKQTLEKARLILSKMRAADKRRARHQSVGRSLERAKENR